MSCQGSVWRSYSNGIRVLDRGTGLEPQKGHADQAPLWHKWGLGWQAEGPEARG